MEKAASGPFFRRLPILVGIGVSYFFFFFAHDEKGGEGKHRSLSTFVITACYLGLVGSLATVWRCGSAACGRIGLQCSRHQCMFDPPGSPEPRLPRALEMSTS